MKRILLVEDDALIARVYSQRLVAEGFEVAVAEDGLAAMKRLPEFKPDLVVLDLMMPKFTGVDVLKFMRGHPDLKNTRVVVFSNSFLGGLVEQVVATGVDKVLIKSSTTPKELVVVLHELLEQRPQVGGKAAQSHEATPPLEPSRVEAVAAPSPPTEPASAKPAIEKGDGTELRARRRREFLESTPAILKGVRDLCREFVGAADPTEQKSRLAELNRKAKFLAQMAAMAGFERIAPLASALEGLAFELERRPAFVNDSSRQTVVSAASMLAQLFDCIGLEEEKPLPPPEILVVDDDLVTNRALVLALGKVHLRAASVTDPFAALKKLEEKPFDLVFLDISMPGLDGLALCEQLRRLPLHRHTPVVFVTSYTDFQTRAQSVLSGGNDFITKPILPVELSVKAFTHLMNRRPDPTADSSVTDGPPTDSP